MITHTQTLKFKTGNLPTFNKALLQVRHIQARLNGRDQSQALWNPVNANFHAPATRWIE